MTDNEVSSGEAISVLRRFPGMTCHSIDWAAWEMSRRDICERADKFGLQQAYIPMFRPLVAALVIGVMIGVSL